MQHLFEHFEGDSLGVAVSFLKDKRQRKLEPRPEWVTWGEQQRVNVPPLERRGQKAV